MIPDKNYTSKEPLPQQSQHKKNKPKTHKNKNAMKKAEEAVRQFHSASDGSIKSDMLGSYTGMSCDGGEPAQDADDL